MAVVTYPTHSSTWGLRMLALMAGHRHHFGWLLALWRSPAMVRARRCHVCHGRAWLRFGNVVCVECRGIGFVEVV